MPARVSAPFPDLDLEESSVISVDTGDPGAIITGMVVHFTQDVPEEPIKVEPFEPLFIYSNESPGLSR